MDPVREDLSDREAEILGWLAEGAADKEIAAKLHLSLNTVKWHNRQIYAKLGVSNRTQAVAQAENLGLLGVQEILVKPVSRIPNNLPAPVSSFVGREQEIEDIKTLLETHRLVTLTGPGGVGKTRLALETAHTLLNEGLFPDGVYFVELAPISDPALVGEAVLEAVGLKLDVGQTEMNRLKLFLKEKTLLLIVDNFEHLLKSTTQVSSILEIAPALRVICTSREALNLGGEQCFPVQPLAIQSSQLLFIQRAREANPAFGPPQDKLLTINEICTRLDRLPLAIELAAARLNIFSLDRLLTSLGERFQILTTGQRDAPERHQTLKDALDWSYQLLREEEQILFGRLAAFQGSRSLDATDVICCSDLKLDALDGLSSLLSKHLIQGEEGLDGEQRFYLLETIHDYAQEQLFQSGERERIEQRHGTFFSELVQIAKDIIRGGGPNRNIWIKKIDADLFNIRKAFTWSISNEHYDISCAFVGSLDYYWLWKGLYDEATNWVELVLDHISAVPLDLQAAAYSSAGMVYYEMNSRHELSERMYLKSLSIYEQLGNKREAGWANTQLININELLPEKRQEVLKYFNSATELLSDCDDKTGIAATLFYLGNHYANSGDYSDAKKFLTKAQDLVLELEDDLRQNAILVALGIVAYYEEDLVTAGKLIREALVNGIAKDFTYYFNVALLIYIGGIATSLGKPYRGCVLLGATNHLLWEKRYKPQASEFHLLDGINNDLVSQLDQEDFQEAWQKGENLTYDEAIAYALEEENITELTDRD